MSSLEKWLNFAVTHKHEFNRVIDIVSKGQDRDRLIDDILRGLAMVALQDGEHK